MEIESEISNEPVAGTSTSDLEKTKTDKCNLFKFMMPESQGQKINTNSKAISAIRKYLEDPVIDLKDNPIEYWESFSDPCLKKLL